MSISIRASSLPAYEVCQRLFAADFLIESGTAHDFGFPDLKRRPNNIGAAIGSACHDGAAEIMRNVQVTGEKGGNNIRNHALAIAGARLMEEFRSIVTMDRSSPNQQTAIASMRAQLSAWHNGLEVESEPEIVEKGYAIELPDDVVITGTMDQFLMNGRLIDLKFGRNKPRALAQVGCYDLILSANGFNVSTVSIDWTQRVAPKRGQPGTVRIAVDRRIAQQQALSIIKNLGVAVDAFSASGDPSDFIASPGCDLCTARHCPAYATSFCEIGAAVNS